MKVGIKALSTIAVLALMLGSMPLIAFANNDGQWPLGVEISGRFDEIISVHQAEIDAFITEHKVLMAETQEERLDIIEGKINELRDAIAEVDGAREALLADLQAGTISGEDLAAEMRNLATDLVSTAKSMGELGKLLGDLGKELSGTLKDRAQALSQDLSDLGDEMAEAGRAIAEEMSGRDLPIPEDLPGKPEDVPPGP